MSENVSAASPAKAPAARFGGRGINVGIAVAAVVAAAGVALWGVQLSGGLVQTGMRNLDSWGLYITMFMFLVGLSAGGLIISSVPRAFGDEGLRRHLEGGRVGVRSATVLAVPGSSWWTSASPPACGSCSRTPTWAARSCAGHPRAGRLPGAVDRLPLGDAARRGGQGVGGRAAL